MTDVIVIGGGINGLACAFRLARDGRKVTLVEGAASTGGAAHWAHLAPRPDARLAGMDLGRHGLEWAASDVPATVLSATGAHRTVQGPRADGPDAAAWETLWNRLKSHADSLAPFNAMTPPRLSGKGNEWGALAKLGLNLRRRGTVPFRDLLRLILTSAADVAEDDLTDPALQGLLAFDATLGAFAGPRSPNTLILLLNRLALGPLGYPKGGPAAVTAAMTRAVRAAGVTLRTGDPVARVWTANHRAAGVVLAGGETLVAQHVVSAISPRTTFLQLVGPRLLDAGFLTRTRQIRARGTTARLTLHLSNMPAFRGANPASRMVIAPSVDAVENAWNPAKYNDIPDDPVMEIVLPRAFDPAAPLTLSALVQSAPPAPADPAKARAALLANTLRVLEAHAPGLGALTEKAELDLPCDIAAAGGPDGGCWHQAEQSVEQMLFLRPTPETAHYATPLPGLWLAGAGSHPGGWLTGSAGWNAAGAIIKGAA
jgi:phytoene dehydrogenase-like protein